MIKSSDELPWLPRLSHVHKESDNKLWHHKLQWQAAMTAHWLHQLLTVGVVDKYIIISPKSGQTIIQNLHLEFLLHSRSNRKTKSGYWIALKRSQAKNNCQSNILIQAMRSLWARIKLYLIPLSSGIPSIHTEEATLETNCKYEQCWIYITHCSQNHTILLQYTDITEVTACCCCIDFGCK